MLSFKQLMERINETRSLNLEEVETIDELSEPTVRNYFNKGGEQGKKITDKMKMSGGDWTNDGSATKTLRKRAAGRAMAYKRRTGEIKMSEEFDFDLFESIMLGEGDLSIRTLYNKYADHALGAGDSPEPKKAAAVKKAIVKVHGATVMGHLEKAKNAAAKNDQDSESTHFNNARNSAKTDTMSATVGKNRSSMRKEEVDLDEGRIKDLAMDMESLSHADFKKKHRRTKQEMQSSLKSESISLDESYDKNSNAHKEAKKLATGGGTRAEYHTDGSATIHVKPPRDAGYSSVTRADHVHKDAGLWHNHSAKELKNKAYIHKGLKYHTKEHDGGNSHTIHISHTSESDEGGEGYGREVKEELKGNQHKIDANKNGKVDGHDFKILRNAKKARYQ